MEAMRLKAEMELVRRALTTHLFNPETRDDEGMAFLHRFCDETGEMGEVETDELRAIMKGKAPADDYFCDRMPTVAEVEAWTGEDEDGNVRGWQLNGFESGEYLLLWERSGHLLGWVMPAEEPNLQIDASTPTAALNPTNGLWTLLISLWTSRLTSGCERRRYADSGTDGGQTLCGGRTLRGACGVLEANAFMGE